MPKCCHYWISETPRRITQRFRDCCIQGRKPEIAENPAGGGFPGIASIPRPDGYRPQARRCLDDSMSIGRSQGNVGEHDHRLCHSLVDPGSGPAIIILGSTKFGRIERPEEFPHRVDTESTKQDGEEHGAAYQLEQCPAKANGDDRHPTPERQEKRMTEIQERPHRLSPRPLSARVIAPCPLPS